MKKKWTIRYLLFASLLALGGSLFFTSCEDDYYYDDEEPAWLGESIYDYLKNDGHYTYYVRMIDEAGYAEVLKKTGAKTLFVAKDEAFEAFFANNPYGIQNFEQFSKTQLANILYAGMIDETYLVEMLSSTRGTPPAVGQAMRRDTHLAVLDSIPFESGEELPKNNYWTRFYDKGIYVLRDNSKWTMVHFLAPQMSSKGITNEDFKYITKKDANSPGITIGYSLDKNGNSIKDAYIFNIKIVERDITCKNGYVNVLESLLFPPDNMAQYVRTNSEISLFSGFLERFSAPFYDQASTLSYRNAHPDFVDSIFVKRYFTSTFSRDPNNVIQSGLLKFDPGWNSYEFASNKQTDMAALFIPTNEALEAYFNSPESDFLKARYGKWENVPNNVLNTFIDNHMRESFVASVPSRFSTLEDPVGTKMGVKPEDIRYAHICSNGVVYVTNKVYPPTDYISVWGPVLVSANTRIFRKAVESLQFKLYLLSMVNKFSFIVPTDETLTNYVNPVSMAKPVKERWAFWYDELKDVVNATVYDLTTGDSLRLASAGEVSNALQDILDRHTVVGNIEDGKKYYMTKGGGTLQVGDTKGLNMVVKSGGNIEQGTSPKVTKIYPMQNGNTYFMSEMLQPALHSVYSILSTEPQFKEFFDLCSGADSIVYYDDNHPKKTYGGVVFAKDKTGTVIDYNVAFFNTFNYTMYIPSNEAVRAAINSGKIKTWELIDALPEGSLERAEAMEELYQFIRYHFQDNSVYVSGETVNREYETATMNPLINRFYKLKVQGDGTGLTLSSPDYPQGGTVKVITSGGLYNIMARDYLFDKSVTTISTSSYVVIHQIDNVLYYKNPNE